jgi:hypothetical protein
VTDKPEPVEVCQAAIMAIFNFKTKFRLSHLQDLVRKGDRRGKTPLGSKKKKNMLRVSVKNHIKSFPRHLSHFNLKNHPKRYYIDRIGVRSIVDMHDLYTLKYIDKPSRACKLNYYRRVFNSYNIGFVGGRTDECGVCKKATSANTRGTRIFKEHLLHAKTAREEMKRIIEEAKNHGNIFVGQRDLKSVTDVPQLTHGEMHYKRALSCYTSIISNAITDEVHLFNWHEAEGHRGVNEMIQVRINFIEAHMGIYEDYDFSEDNCAGQNKSRANPVGDLYAVQNGLASSITTRFYETGHSFMPPDQCGGVINRRLRKHTQKIQTPDAAFELMTRKNPSDFVRHRMKSDQWKDWWRLAEDHTRVLGRKAYTEDGRREDLHFSDIAIWKVCAEHPWSIFFKYSHFLKESWKELKIRKQKNTPLLRAENLHSCNDEIGGVKIKYKKWKDIQEYLILLKPENRSFYQKIAHNEDESDSGSEDERDASPMNYRFQDEWLTPAQL